MSERDRPVHAHLRQMLAAVAESGEDKAVQELAENVAAEDVGEALTLLARTYVALRQRGLDFLPVGQDITATEASVLCHGILEAADLQVFELGLWQSWGNVG